MGIEMKESTLIIGDLKPRVPVIQGGMGVGVSLSKLAGAVAAAGGIGVISTAQIGFQDSDFLKNPLASNLRAIGEEVKKARQIAKDGIIGVNIMVATRRYEEYVKAAVLAGVDLIISGAGLPMKLPELIGAAKTKIAPIVSSLKSFQVITKYWMKKYNRIPDFVIIEGPEAGGHLGFRKEELDSISRETYDKEIEKIIDLANELSVPVIVAGGVYTKEDMKRYLEMGANGVQVATRFVTTTECDASDAYKNAYLSAKKEDIVIIDSPVGMPGRAIRNAFLDEIKQGNKKVTQCKQCIEHCDPLTTPYCITDALINAVTGDCENGLLFCGSMLIERQK